jgi:poly(3-hydroxybutyrate) depolymerase
MHPCLLIAITWSALAGNVEDRNWLDPLDAALVDYFQAGSPEVRSEIAARVAAIPGANVDTVASRLHSLPLWQPAKPGVTSFEMETKTGGRRSVWVRVPPNYDPAKPWPAVITLHGTGGRARRQLEFTVGLLAARADAVIVAAPQAESGGPFNPHDESETDQPVRLLRILRRRYHIDSDRVYLTGYSKGGHRTCSAAVMFADRFAGAMPLAGCMSLVQREGLYPQFLPNLQHLPMLLVWGEQDTRTPAGRESADGGIAGVNRRFAEAAKQMELPVTAVELPGVGHASVKPPADLLADLLSLKRKRYPRRVSHWFRYPGQGHAYWLGLVEFLGQPWSDGRMHVKLKPGDDPQEAILRETRNRMGRLTGVIDGQLVTVHAKRAKVLDVLLHDELIDLDQPITVKINGRRAFQGMVQRRVETLLESAAEEWDFDRLFTVRIRIPTGRRGLQR